MKTYCNPIKQLNLVVLSASAILGWATQSQAATLVSVDFTKKDSIGTTATGAGILSGGSNLWNDIDSLTAYTNQALTDSNGSASSYTLTISTNTYAGYDLAANTAPVTPAAAQSVMNDYLWRSNETVSYAISGLTAGASYDLVVYSGVPTSYSYGAATISINGSAWGTVTGGDSLATNGNGYYRGLATANGSGTILVTHGLTASGGIWEPSKFSIANGFQITIPEPSSALLGGLGLLGLLGVRRRRN